MLVSQPQFYRFFNEKTSFFKETPLANGSTKSKKVHLSTILRILVAVLALSWIIFRADRDPEKLKAAFLELNLLTVIAAILLFMLANVVIGCRWYLLLRAQHIRVRLGPCIRIHFLGMFYNNILISSVGGDLLRALYITKHTHKRLEAALSVLVDRIVGLFTLVLMAVSFYVFFPVEGEAGDLDFSVDIDIAGKLSQYRWVHVAVGVLAVAGVVGVFIHPAGRKKLHLACAKGASGFERVFLAIRLYCRKPFTILLSIGLTFIAQSLPILGFVLIGRSMGLEVSTKYYFVIFPIGWVIGALPISVGGLGVLEGTIIGLVVLLAGEQWRAQAEILAGCQRVMFLLASLPGIVIHIMGAHLPAEQEGDCRL